MRNCQSKSTNCNKRATSKTKMKTPRLLLDAANSELQKLKGECFEFISLSAPSNEAEALTYVKILSKLSPLIGNLIEFKVVSYLNSLKLFKDFGKWERQDPGFPDAVFRGSFNPAPGFEIKAWYPMSTEITARFKDSQNFFSACEVDVVLLSWIPEFLIYGKPVIIDMVIIPGKSIAESRDQHYHNPPDYLVLEPQDTSTRTSNLQQSNTNGYKIQADKESKEFAKAKSIVDSWGKSGKVYSPSVAYQTKIESLKSQFIYRLDTNYAKIDRIDCKSIEDFKQRVLKRKIYGKTIKDWSSIFSKAEDHNIPSELQDLIKQIE